MNEITTTYIEIVNEKGLKIILSDLGAAIYAIYVNDVPMTLSPADLLDFEKPRTYHGKSIGRVAGRIKDGKFEINGKQYQVELNEAGTKTLHGGFNGVSTKIFDYKTLELDDKTIVDFHYLSKDNEAGFPGALDINVKYTIYHDELSIKIEFDAFASEDTLCKLTNHAYFCLGSHKIDELKLQLNCPSFIEVDNETLIPLRDVSVEERPCCDFREGKYIVQDIENPYLKDSCTKGYDMHFNFEEIKTEIPQIILSNNEYQMEITTNFQGTQIYSDNFINEIPFLTNDVDHHRRGVAIEPQDSHLYDHILRKDEHYSRFIKYTFKVKN